MFGLLILFTAVIQVSSRDDVDGNTEAERRAFTFHDCPRENGFCDHNNGAIKINSLDGDTEAAQTECMRHCIQRKDATGCELIWNQSNRGCYVHTRPISRGNGIRNHYCWVFSKCRKEKIVTIPHGMVGKWELNYSNKHKDTYTITADGSITLGHNGKTRKIYRSDNPDKFPSSQGWFLVKNLFRAQAWEYARLKADRTLEVHHFCIDGCGAVYNGLSEYCCEALGWKEGSRIPRGMVGRWKLNYSVQHKDTYTITADGSITLGYNGVKQYIQASDNQDKFPSSQGWFLVKNLFRAQVWEYVRLKANGAMEVRHFCNDGCRAVYNGLSKYCCVATGLKEGTFV